MRRVSEMVEVSVVGVDAAAGHLGVAAIGLSVTVMRNGSVKSTNGILVLTSRHERTVDTHARLHVHGEHTAR